MGRTREHRNDAARQRAYRQRKAAEEARRKEELERLRRQGGAASKSHKRQLVSAKLVKILGMLGSDHDGERAAAARKASELLKEAGLTWYDILDVEQPSGRKK